MKILIYILIIVGWAVKNYIDAKQKRASQKQNTPEEDRNNQNEIPSAREIVISQTTSNRKPTYQTQPIVVKETKRKEKKASEYKSIPVKTEKKEDVLIDFDSQKEEALLLEEEIIEFDARKAFIYSEIIRPKYI